MDQQEIDRQNAEFWNELCGTGLAKYLGITDHSRASLDKFDNYYFDMYPYLLPFIRPDKMNGKRVLEIGLGYGSVGQKIAEAGANYTGLDLAPNAVQMTKNRMGMQRLNGTAVVGSALEMPFPDSHFDYVVSIGCFHHTGNVHRCLDETYRVLRPGGAAVLMVYNKFSFRQWVNWPKETFLSIFKAARRPDRITSSRRAQYDANGAGMACPETVLVSIDDLRWMLHRFDKVTFQKQNADPIIYKGRLVIDRPQLLPSLGRVLGLDIYFKAFKGVAAQHLAA